MNNDEIRNLPRDEKIELLRAIVNGTVKRIGGLLIDMGPDSFVGITLKDGKEYFDVECKVEVPPNFWDEFQGSSIALPDNTR